MPVRDSLRAAVLLARAVQLPEDRQAVEAVIKDRVELRNGAWTSYRWVEDEGKCIVESTEPSTGETRRLRPAENRDAGPSLTLPFLLMDEFLYQDQFLCGGFERSVCPARAEISYGNGLSFRADDVLVTVSRLADLPVAIFGVSLAFAGVSVPDTIQVRRALYRDDVSMAISVGMGQPAFSPRSLCLEVNASSGQRSGQTQRLGDIECTFAVTEILMPGSRPEDLTSHERYGLLRCDESYLMAPSDKVIRSLRDCELPAEAGITWYTNDLHLFVVNSKTVGSDANPIDVDSLSISSRAKAIPVFAHSFAEIAACYKGAHELIAAHSVDLVTSTRRRAVSRLSTMQREIAAIKRKAQPLMMRETDIVPKTLLRNEQVKAIVDRADSILKDSKEAVELEARVQALSMDHLLSALFLFGALIGVGNFLLPLLPRQSTAERITAAAAAVLISATAFILLRIRSG